MDLLYVVNDSAAKNGVNKINPRELLDKRLDELEEYLKNKKN